MPRSTGKQTPTYNRLEIRFSPFSGDETIYEVEGPKAGMMPLISELKNLGFAGSYIEDKTPLAKITYQVPKLDDGGDGDDDELPIPIWEFFGNTQEIDLLEDDYFAANLTDEERRMIREAINNPVEGQSPALTTSLAINTYLLMLKGVRSKRVTVPTLRVTRAVSTAWPILNPLVSVESIYSSTTLRNVEGIPAQIILPAGFSSDSNFVFGWYKKFPQVQQTGFNKYNISQEWEYGKWATLIYGTAL